jgi:hypothetical protein
VPIEEEDRQNMPLEGIVEFASSIGIDDPEGVRACVRICIVLCWIGLDWIKWRVRARVCGCWRGERERERKREKERWI